MLTSSASRSAIVIRSINLLSEMRAVEELQKEVWGPEDVVPLTHLAASTEVGGQLIGAFEGEQLIGFAYGFIGQEGGHSVIHSHMLAVKPSYRDQDLGYKLKLAQREKALAQGFTRITWTFDPLQSRNAHLNFGKLGVVACQYKVNFYGEDSPSPLHRHVGTDRLWVTWLLASTRVRTRLEGKRDTGHLPSAIEQAAPLVQSETDGSPRMLQLDEGLTHEHVSIEIPPDIGSLQQQDPLMAITWRKATRHAFTGALAAGYLVKEFYRPAGNERKRSIYLLSRAEKLEDFT
jgi:predicted GNAT superfamily acetyltransferase